LNREGKDRNSRGCHMDSRGYGKNRKGNDLNSGGKDRNCRGYGKNRRGNDRNGKGNDKNCEGNDRNSRRNDRNCERNDRNGRRCGRNCRMANSSFKFGPQPFDCQCKIIRGTTLEGGPSLLKRFCTCVESFVWK